MTLSVPDVVSRLDDSVLMGFCKWLEFFGFTISEFRIKTSAQFLQVCYALLVMIPTIEILVEVLTPCEFVDYYTILLCGLADVSNSRVGEAPSESTGIDQAAFAVAVSKIVGCIEQQAEEQARTSARTNRNRRISRIEAVPARARDGVVMLLGFLVS